MAKGYIALCALLLQAACTQAAPADTTELLSPRPSLGFVDQHIVGGEYVDIEKVPYQLSLQMAWMHTCGAAIVHENYALTAAHCNVKLDFLTRFTVWLTAGSTTMFPFNFGGTKHFLEKFEAHPSFSMRTLDFDVAVMKVKKPFKFGKTVQALPLPLQGYPEESYIDYSYNATISGWGLTSEGNVFGPVYLKKNEVGLVRRDTCKVAYSSINEVTTRMICAGGYEKGDTCQGDSGGPLAHRGILIGLVSWGIGCNRPIYPGVYTNLMQPEVRAFVNQQSGL